MVVSKDLKSYLISKGYVYIPSNKMQKEYFQKQNKGSRSVILTEKENGYYYQFEIMSFIRTKEAMKVVDDDFKELCDLVDEINAKEIRI